MKLVRESLDFTRGGDSYSSLQIGKHFLIKKWLEEYDIIDYIINDDLTIDVKGVVYLSYKKLTSFPEYIKFNKVGGNFYCSNNQLISLVGSPSSVGKNFSCKNNQLTSLEGCPSSVEGSFYCFNNEKRFSKEEVRKYCKVKGNIYV